MKLRIITRNSPLALWQANHVKSLITQYHPQCRCHIIPTTSQGDRTQQALTNIGGKNLFVKDLQVALLNGTADIAVHSIKDISVYPTPGLVLACFIMRDDVRDVFISNKFNRISDLSSGSTIGTSSPRRACQLKNQYPQIEIKAIRGNVGTRLKKLDDGDYDAIVLAAAGLKRLKLSHLVNEYLNPMEFIPAIGQGAIGIECRTNDTQIQQLLKPINDSSAECTVLAERAVNQILGGDCFTPIGAYSHIDNETLQIHATIGSLTNNQIIRVNRSGSIKNPQQLGYQAAEQLIAMGAKALLKK